MDELILIDAACLIIGIVGIVLAYFFYLKTKQQEEAVAAENKTALMEIRGSITEQTIKLNDIEVGLAQFQIQGDVINYPEIQQKTDARKRLEAFFIGIFVTILLAAIIAYLTKPRKRS
ncbi:hypothetical protein [Methanoregula sp. UBA64]|jgi:hypothetical protein|uniref:hypothetical protein n=1 Tax=Methanoregula sp. UBA64 TaxID=1915554 RepID=UPI0025DA4795|nr:hypothetical protein [Methanoregula sp. UBA64]